MYICVERCICSKTLLWLVATAIACGYAPQLRLHCSLHILWFADSRSCCTSGVHLHLSSLTALSLTLQASFSVLKAESVLPAKSLRRSIPNHHLQQLLSSITSIGPVEPREGWPARHCAATGQQDLSERSTGLDMSWLAVKRGSGCVQLMPEGVVGQLATSHAHVTIMFAGAYLGALPKV